MAEYGFAIHSIFGVFYVKNCSQEWNYNTLLLEHGNTAIWHVCVSSFCQFFPTAYFSTWENLLLLGAFVRGKNVQKGMQSISVRFPFHNLYCAECFGKDSKLPTLTDYYINMNFYGIAEFVTCMIS